VKMKKILIIGMIFSLLAGIAAAQDDIGLEAKLERDRVSIGNPVYLYLTFYGSQSLSKPEMESIDGLQISYVGPSTRISVVNGKVTRSITHTFLLLPLKERDFKIGPFSVEYKGQTYQAGPVELIASSVPAPGRRSQAPPASVPVGTATADKKPYIGDRLFLTMDTTKKRVYLNEMIPITIKLYVYNMSLREIEYPVYSHEGFSAGKATEPTRQKEMYAGNMYDVLEFRQVLYPLKEGDYTLGPASLSAKILTKERTKRSAFFDWSIFEDDFFFGSQTYPVEVESKTVPITVLPFPEKGKPQDFSGTVGDFDLEVLIEPKKVKVGDPIVVRMIVSGKGNLDTVTVPYISVPDDFKTYEPQVTKKEKIKIYEKIIIPKSENVKEIPEVTFSFFNPDFGRYETIKKGPFPVEVASQPDQEKAVRFVSVPGTEQLIYPEEKLGSDIIHIKEDIGKVYMKGKRLHNNPFFWLMQSIPAVLFGAFFIAYRRKEKLRTDKRYARAFHAPRKARKGIARAKAYLDKGNTAQFYDAVFKVLQDYLGDKFNLPKGSITSQIIENELRPAGYDEKVLDMLHEVFLKCEMARYASSVPGGEEAAEVMEKVKSIFDYIERSKK